MNLLFILMILASFLATIWQTLSPTANTTIAPITQLSNGMLEAAQQAVELSIGLVGVITFFLGLMKVAENAGLLKTIAKFISPLLVRLFPEVPRDHPAIGAMFMNFSANILGMGNAATPFGLKTMEHLQSLNPHPHKATHAMILFLAINTSSVTIIPTTVIALRQASGSLDAAGIIPTTLFATLLSTLAAIVLAKTAQRFCSDQPQSSHPQHYSALFFFALLLSLLSVLVAIVLYGQIIAPWLLPAIVVAIISLGALKKMNVYGAFVEGGKEGFEIALRILPYLVAILVAIGMMRSSGLLSLIIQALSPFTRMLGMPDAALPMAIFRPFSGSGSYGIMASLFQDPAFGPDSLAGYMVSTFQGSTETTFYVLALYFGSIGITQTRYMIPVALTADLVGILSSVWIVNWWFGA